MMTNGYRVRGGALLSKFYSSTKILSTRATAVVQMVEMPQVQRLCPCHRGPGLMLTCDPLKKKKTRIKAKEQLKHIYYQLNS